MNGAEHTVLSWETQVDQNGSRHLALYTETIDDELDRVVGQPNVTGNESNPIGHAIKKLLCAGARGSKDREKDLNEAVASIQRALELEQT